MNLLQDDGTYHDYTFFCPDTFILIPQIITGLNNDDTDVAEVDIVDTYVLDCPVDDNIGHHTIKLRRIDSRIEVFLGTVNIGSFADTSRPLTRESSVTGLSTMGGAILVVNQKKTL